MKNIPEIRFKEFEEEWLEEQMGDIVDIVMGQSPSSVNYTNNPNDNILVQGNADMHKGKVVPRIWTTQITKQAEKGDLILSIRAPVGDVGKTDYNVVLGRGVAGIKGNEFVFQLLTKMKEDGFWNKVSTGSTFESINSNNIKEALVTTPKTSEQQKIGNFFRQLDQLIEHQEAKLKKVTQLKAAMLDKMFPKEGSRVPEIRFKGFEGEWEEKKLEKIASYRNGKAHENIIVENGRFIVVNSKFISTEGAVKKLTNVQIEPLYKDEIVFVLSDVPNGRALAKTYIIDENNKYTLNQRIAGISPNDDCYPYFLFILLNRNKYFLKFDDGAKQTNLSISDILEFQEFYPNFKEQQKIGSYFQKLDKLIELQGQKLEKLRHIKKSLLSKMFVSSGS